VKKNFFQDLISSRGINHQRNHEKNDLHRSESRKEWEYGENHHTNDNNIVSINQDSINL
jgi:hypothetical protein